jgi:hypothetical protein
MLVNIVILFSSLKEEEVTAVEEMSYAIICSIALGWEEKLMPELQEKGRRKRKTVSWKTLCVPAPRFRFYEMAGAIALYVMLDIGNSSY